MRQAIDDGGWFDPTSATHYPEGESHDGHNVVSCATGSQWDHEALYHTRSGSWVLHRWSQWQGAGERYETISHLAAVQWLIRNGHEVSDADAARMEV